MRAAGHGGLDLEAMIRGVYSDGEGFHVSPDGRSVAFVWNMSGQWQIHLMRFGDKQSTQLTMGSESSLSPRFSPNGKHLAYCQDCQGDEKFDIFLRDPESKESNNITPNTDESILPFIRWSADGKRIALASNKTGKFCVYSMPSEGGECQLLCDHRYDDSDPQWAPDGKRIMFTSMTKGQDHGVFIVSAIGGESLQLGDESGALDASMPDWSLDSRRIAFASTSRGMSDIGIYDRANHSVEWLTDSTRECYAPCWSPDGQYVAYRENHDGNIAIALQRLGAEKRSFQVGPGIHTQLAFTPDSKHLIFTFSGPRHPSDLWILNIAEEKFSLLTDSLDPSINPEILVLPTIVRFKSVGEQSIPGLLYKPAATKEDKKPPAIVYIHGGPSAQHDNDWYPSVQDLVARDFVVLAPNYRGSTGYGRKFRDANRFVMGRDDLADVVAAADYLVKENLVDPERIAVTGISFGGYLTMCALTKHPDRWAVGSALFPFLNWFTEFENEREDLRYWDRENMGNPKEDPDRFREASPIFFMDKVRAPAQLMAGTQDVRCPLSESVQARDILLKLGKTVDFVVYEDEGHSFRKVQNRVDAWKRRAAFLERHLKASPSSP